MRTLAGFIAAFAIAAQPGCFEDSGAGGEGCPAGAAGCDCTAGGGCDPGLECVAEIEVCVPEGCDAGKLGCTCVDSQCIGGLVCDGGVCKDVATDGSSDATASTTTATATTSQVETTVAESSGDATGEASSTSAADSGESGSSTGDPPGCLHCWPAFMQGVHTPNASVCPSSVAILDPFYNCVCSAVNCGFEDYPCKNEQNPNYCDGVPPDSGCEMCAMNSCAADYSACQADASN